MYFYSTLIILFFALIILRIKVTQDRNSTRTHTALHRHCSVLLRKYCSNLTEVLKQASQELWRNQHRYGTKATGLSRTKRTLDVRLALNIFSYIRNTNFKYFPLKADCSYNTYHTQHHTCNKISHKQPQLHNNNKPPFKICYLPPRLLTLHSESFCRLSSGKQKDN